MYSLILGAVVLFNCGALYWLSLQAQPVSGGLTRIGELPESDYGFNAPQMRFKRRLSVAGIYERPCDVVVIGDSFCETPEGGAWVDFLADRLGISVVVLPWWTSIQELVRTEPFRSFPPKMVIYESVERLLKERQGHKPPEGRDAGLHLKTLPRIEVRPQNERREPFSRPLRKTFLSADIRQAKDSLVAEAWRRVGLEPKKVRIHRLTKAMFSSRKADVLLVYYMDGGPQGWSAGDLENIEGNLLACQKEVEGNGKTLFLAMVIPNKLTAYSGYLAAGCIPVLRLSDRLSRRGIRHVPLEGVIERAVREGGTDVYLPNDTHLGVRGAEAVSEAVVSELRRLGCLSPALQPLRPAK